MSVSAAKPGGEIGVTGFLHFSFTVRDVERSVLFYRDVLGMEVMWSTARGEAGFIREEKQTYVVGVTGYDDAHLKIALVRSGMAVLELIEYVQPKGEPIPPGTHRPGSPHLALTVADIDKAWGVLQRQADRWGLSFASKGPVTIDRGANVGGKAIYFRDPDGITIELVELNARWSREESVK